MTARLQHGYELCRPKANVIIFKMTCKYRAQMKRRKAKFPSVRLSLSPIQSLCWKQSPQRDAANTALHHRVRVLSDVWFPQDTTPRTEAHQFSLGFNLSYFFVISLHVSLSEERLQSKTQQLHCWLSSEDLWGSTRAIIWFLLTEILDTFNKRLQHNKRWKSAAGYWPNTFWMHCTTEV